MDHNLPAGDGNCRDTIFESPDHPARGAFRFDEDVSRVFPDMISRSVPGYGNILSMTGMFARSQVGPAEVCYDLGCSLGAATLAVRRGINAPGCVIYGIDDSPAMLERCRQNMEEDNSQVEVRLVESDVRQVDFLPCAMVVCNFTLQFLPPGDRLPLLEKIHAALRPGGLLVLSEKVGFDDSGEQETMTRWHHEFKRLCGYSDLEIARKRQALENVLVPDTIATHHARLSDAGFGRVVTWFQWFNFASLCAWKDS